MGGGGDLDVQCPTARPESEMILGLWTLLGLWNNYGNGFTMAYIGSTIVYRDCVMNPKAYIEIVYTFMPALSRRSFNEIL